MRLNLLSVFAIVFIACNTPETGDSEGGQPSSDSLLQQVLDGHDVVMPKMHQIERMQKDIQNRIDSLRKTPDTKVQKESIASLKTTLEGLKNANASMHNWMGGFKYDSLKDNEEMRISYLKAQLESVNKMKDSVLSSIDNADSILSKFP